MTQADAALVFYDWIPDTGNYAEGFDLSAQEKRALLRSHVNLGHPGRAEFVRILKGAGRRSDIIQYVQPEYKCAGCDLEQRPPTRLPAATPRTYDFNVVIGIDVLFIHGVDNRTERPILNITCLETLYSTFGVIDPLRRSSKLTLKAFERLWLRTFGPADYILYDQGTEFTGGDFQSGLEKFSILPLITSQDARWENGVCERRGDLFKKIYYKSREVVQPSDLDEVELLVFESAWALQTTCNPIRVYPGGSWDDKLDWLGILSGMTGTTSSPRPRTKHGSEPMKYAKQLAKRSETGGNTSRGRRWIQHSQVGPTRGAPFCATQRAR